ncbi:MAG: hypothetical protein R3E96_08110 [Planctomycetota bacterium]
MSSGLPDGLLADLLLAPDRADAPGQTPITALTGEESEEELAPYRPWILETIELERRGVLHGAWLHWRDEARASVPPAPVPAIWSKLWHEAEPIPLPGWAPPVPREQCETWHAMLREPAGLRRLLGERQTALGADFAPGRDLVRVDRDRDLARQSIGREGDLWVKVGRLSTFEGDASLRVRHSFGHEVHDDASRDIERHRAVTEIARRLWPFVGRLPEADEWSQRLADWIGGPVLRTQHIVYFNAPNGGALWHHDGFDEPKPAGGAVCSTCLQLSGRTAWLACSIDSLARRVREFLEILEQGDLPWVMDETSPQSL